MDYFTDLIHSALIWATFIGFFLFGDLPDVWTIMGAAIIILSGLYLIRQEGNFVTN